MNSRVAFITLIATVFLISAIGCATSDRSNSGWIVIGQPDSSPPANAKKPPKNNKGQQVAAQNHIRSAYRFLQKNKPDHAMRELEKARRKMGSNYWFHYYFGGAYFLKGMHSQARDSWEIAFGFTNQYTLRSRIRTVQSFAVFSLQGEGSSMSFLKKAMSIDKENRTAMELFEDLGGSKDVDNNASKKGHGKGKSKYGNSNKKPDKNKSKKHKIQDNNRFSVYFMVEMP